MRAPYTVRPFHWCISLSTRYRRIGLLTYCWHQLYVSKNTQQSTSISIYFHLCACSVFIEITVVAAVGLIINFYTMHTHTPFITWTAHSFFYFSTIHVLSVPAIPFDMYSSRKSLKITETYGERTQAGGHSKWNLFFLGGCRSRQ